MKKMLDNPDLEITTEVTAPGELAIYLDGQKVGTVEVQQDTTMADTRYVVLIGHGLMIEDADGGYVQHAIFGGGAAQTVTLEEPV